MADVFARYYEKQGKFAVSGDIQRRSLYLALERINPGIVVADFNLDTQYALARRMEIDGYQRGATRSGWGEGGSDLGLEKWRA